MSKEFKSGIQAGAGFAGSFLQIEEADFAAAPGDPYVPPERGTFRTVAARTVQFLADITGVVTTNQTSAATIRAPSGATATDDAGPGREIFIRNLGVGDITVQDNLGGAVGTIAATDDALLVHTENNVWLLMPLSGGAGPSAALRYFTTVVGNALEGDLAADVDFLDPGDGTGIAGAIAALPATGGTILVRKGTYTLTAALTIARSDIKILGEGMGSTTLIGPVGDNLFAIGDGVTLRSNIEIAGFTMVDGDAANFSFGAVIGDGVSDLYVHDCEFTGLAGPFTGWVAVGIVDSAPLGISDITVENCRSSGEGGVVNVFGSGALAIGHYGINGATRVLIADNQIAISGNLNAMLLSGLSNFNVRDNEITGSVGSTLITISTSNHGSFAGNVIDVSVTTDCVGITTCENVSTTGNSITLTAAGTGINYSSSSEGSISGNSIEGSSTAIICTNSPNTAVVGNQILSPGSIGINWNESADAGQAVVDGNLIVDAGITGIQINTDDIIISNNQIISPVAATAEGINILGSPVRVLITGNHISECTTGIDFTPSSGSDNTITGNIIATCTTGLTIDVNQTQISNNSFQDNTTALTVAGNDCTITDNQGDGNTTDFSDSGDRNYWRDNWFQLPTASTSGAGGVFIFQATLQSRKTYLFQVETTAQRTDGVAQDHLMEKVTFGIDIDNGGTATITAISTDFNDQSNATLNVTYGIAGLILSITVIGVGAQDYDWTSRVRWRNT